MQFTDLCGQEHAKRALEVALAGNHSIRFTGSYTSQAGSFAKLARELGLVARSTGPCPCGNYGHPVKECTCSTQTVGKFQAREKIKPFDIEIEVWGDDEHKILAWLQGKRGETNEAILTRVQGASDFDDLTLGETSLSLLRAAIRQLSMDFPTVARILAVARTIANLAHAEQIQTVHLAEAIQYRPRR